MSIGRDPYWPKWDSPWWQMTLLWEMGLARAIPERAVAGMIQAMDAHYLHHFPIRQSELPEGTDPHRGVACHCALGTMYQVLHAYGIEVDRELPWIRNWFLTYQLPDGGLNCDERAYAKTGGKSSVVSTLPPLEAVLFCTKRPFTAEEERFLDRGAQYLIDHKLYRSRTTGGVIHEDWLELCFPRFYEYDILRGLHYLACWAEKRHKTIPRPAIEEALGLMRAKMKNRNLETSRVMVAGKKTLIEGGDGAWVRVDAETFELLDRVSAPGTPNQWLTAQWNRVREILGRGY